MENGANQIHAFFFIRTHFIYTNIQAEIWLRCQAYVWKKLRTTAGGCDERSDELYTVILQPQFFCVCFMSLFLIWLRYMVYGLAFMNMSF